MTYRGERFDPRTRAASFAQVAAKLGMTVARVRCLETNALNKFRRQKVRDKLARWRELVEAAALLARERSYRDRSGFRWECEPVFEMEILDVPAGVPAFQRVNYRRAGGRTVRVPRGGK